MKIFENYTIKDFCRIDRVKDGTILSLMKSNVYKILEKYLQLRGFKFIDKDSKLLSLAGINVTELPTI